MTHDRARHCPTCGAGLTSADVGGRPRRRCSTCGFVLYLNPASAAAGVVVNEARQVLLVRRAIEPFRGHWALPAGYQEIDEDPVTTVVREVREEAGIDVAVVGLLDLLFVEDPRKPANVAVFLCHPEGGELRAGPEEDAASFFALDDLPGPIGFDNYRRILGRLLRSDEYPESPWSLLARKLREGR